MTDSEFLIGVQRAAAVDSPERAERVAAGALQELGRAITPGQADDLAARLPDRFGRAVSDVDRSGDHSDPQPVETYLENVAETADLADEDSLTDRDDLWRTVRGVFAAVQQYAGEELANAADQLPPEYEVVVEPGDRPVAGSFVEVVREETALGEDAPDDAEATLRVLGK